MGSWDLQHGVRKAGAAGWRLGLGSGSHDAPSLAGRAGTTDMTTAVWKHKEAKLDDPFHF